MIFLNKRNLCLSSLKLKRIVKKENKPVDWGWCRTSLHLARAIIVLIRTITTTHLTLWSKVQTVRWHLQVFWSASRGHSNFISYYELSGILCLAPKEAVLTFCLCSCYCFPTWNVLSLYSRSCYNDTPFLEPSLILLAKRNLKYLKIF